MSTKVVAIIALLCALIAGSAGWQQRRGALELKKQIASLTAEVKEKSDLVHQQEMLLRQLREENGAYMRESAALREKISARASSPTLAQDAAPSPSSSSSKQGKGEVFSKMLEDPKMKKVFRQQHILQLKQIYSDFVKERHLNPHQSKQFFDLLADGGLREMEDGVRLFKGGENDASSSGMEEQASATQKTESDRQMRMLLGDVDYQAYKAYERTTGERMALAQVREQIGLAGSPLHDDQAKALFQIMTEERSRTPPTAFDPRGSGSVRERFTPLLENNNGEGYLQAQADLNQRILNRTAAILSQEQYDALERFQEQQLEMEKIGVEMTRQLMGQRDEGDSSITVLTPAP